MIDQVLNRLPNVRKSGRGWQSRCPAHNDKGPSLSIAEGSKGVLMHCHAGCTIDEVCSAIGMQPRDLFYEYLAKMPDSSSDLDDYIIAIARADIASGRNLSQEDQQSYVQAVRRKI